MSTSQNGWPALASNSPYLWTWTLADGTRLRLRGGCAGFCLVHLASRFDRRVEALKEPVLDDWGYAFRPVRGYVTTLSNHASGTAEDLNSTDHGLGAEHTFTPKEVDTIHHLLAAYEGCIRWGGDYEGRKDPMHFEINKPLREVNRVAIRLMNTPRGTEILKLNPGQRAVILS